MRPEEKAIPTRKPHRVKTIAPATTRAPVAPVPDAHAAELSRLQNLALIACAKGIYIEPHDASAIAYAQQALALDPANDYTRTILDNSIQGAEHQIHQAIAGKDFGNAKRLANLLGQLLPGDKTVADLQADLVKAEKAQEDAGRASQPPTPALSFRVDHLHSSKGGDKGAYCSGTLSVVSGHLKYTSDATQDGQYHNFDIACSDVVEMKKNSRVAFWEKGFHIRTASGTINFIPASGTASSIRALASACSE